jgi:peptidyl-prolyl cis-trans isomerase C
MFMRLLTAASVAALLAAGPAAADEAALATVNGTAITQADVDFAKQSIGEALARFPASQRDEMVLALLIDMRVLADAAEAKGLADTPEFRQRMAAIRTQTLRDVYMEKVVDATVTDEAVRARYDEEITKAGPREEVSAAHILVPTEEQAKAIIVALDGGADFAKLAEENSTDPGSKTRGGSLGYFGKGQMVPEFEAAAFALEPGTYTKEPVQSQFGWHVIKVEDKREQPLPGYDDVKDQIREIMAREAFVAELNRLKETATIETAAQPAAAQPAETPSEQPAQQ